MIVNENTVLASEAGGSEYGRHGRILRPTVLSTNFAIILILACIQVFEKTEISGEAQHFAEQLLKPTFVSFRDQVMRISLRPYLPQAFPLGRVGRPTASRPHRSR